MTPAMLPANLNPETDLVLERALKAPRHAVWECWTQPEHILHFFVPKPHKVTACAIDLRVGGHFNTTFEVEGNAIHNTGIWLEIVPETRLVFTDAYGEEWQPAENPFMTAILSFADAPGGGTLYTAVARHRTQIARKEHEEMGFHAGWGVVADQLDAYALTL